MKNHRKTSALVLFCVLMLMSSSVFGTTEDFLSEERMAERLKELKLFMGVVTEDGGTDFQAEHTIETDSATILGGYETGLPHRNGFMTVIYKSGAVMPEGTVVYLPLPTANFMGVSGSPQKVELSEDGETLIYSIYFAEKDIADEGEPHERLIHEKGTYRYRFNLKTGAIKFEILPDQE